MAITNNPYPTMRNDHALIRRWESPSQTPGGLFLPEKARELVQFGIIISIGPKKNPGLRAGDTVLLQKFAGIPYIHNEEILYILHTDELLAQLEF